jgi:hypothetical protein
VTTYKRFPVRGSATRAVPQAANTYFEPTDEIDATNVQEAIEEITDGTFAAEVASLKVTGLTDAPVYADADGDLAEMSVGGNLAYSSGSIDLADSPDVESIAIGTAGAAPITSNVTLSGNNGVSFTMQAGSADPNYLLQCKDKGGVVRFRLDKYAIVDQVQAFVLGASTSAYGRLEIPYTAIAGDYGGMALYYNGANTVALAQSNAASTSNVVGLARNDTANAYVFLGKCQLSTQTAGRSNAWGNALESGATGGLQSGKPYYLSASAAGKLTATAPSTSGQYVVRVGVALNTTTMLVTPSQPIVVP